MLKTLPISVPNRRDPTPEQIERALIGSGSPKRPYGVKLVFTVLHEEYIEPLLDMSLLMPSGTFAKVSVVEQAPGLGGRRFEIKLDGFARATAAEAAGRHLTQTMLLLAVSLDFGLRLEYVTHEPANIYERFRSDGLTLSGYGLAMWPQHAVLKALSDTLSCAEMPSGLLISIELYCSSLLEANRRAQFVGVVSALEPLAAPARLGDSVDGFIARMLADLEQDVDIPPDLKQSMRGRVRLLQSESIRQSLRRLCGEWFPDSAKAWQTVDRAYRLRSELLHSGAFADPDTDAAVEASEVRRVLRAIYQRWAKQPFKAPATI
ncbi:hypothetical protein [Variovorax boronicumulans]|uniref:hypothetical protein n=1 Tax=Variovorax boronicumulans TaxID=436515 RepID=UPI003395245D